MAQLHLNHRLRLATIIVYQLRHLYITIGISRGMMEGGNGSEFPSLTGTITTL